MRLKLDDDNKGHSGFLSERFDKKAVFEMVEEYRRGKDPKKDLMYSHFQLDEILQLCIDNGVLDANKTIQAQLKNAATKGLKLYLGKHKNDLTGNYERYREHTTVIICNTKVESREDYKYEDLLKNKKNSVSIAVPNLSPDGTALDMTNICPPDCVTIPQDPYDIAYCTTCR